MYGAKKEKDENFFYVKRKSRGVMNGVKMNLANTCGKHYILIALK